MVSHAGYLRDFWDGEDDDWLAVVRGMHGLGEAAATLAPVAAVDAGVTRLSAWPGLSAADQALLRFVLRLTVAPRSMTAAEVARLGEAGFDDRSIHDIVMVCACFSFMNRLADGTGVSLQAGREGLAVELFGQAALDAHRRWGAEPSSG